MQFQKLLVSDIKTIKPYLTNVNARTCDFTVGGMFMWRKYFSMEFCERDKAIFSRLYAENGKCYYNLPMAADTRNALSILMNDVKRKREYSISFCTIPAEYLPLFGGLQAKITEESNFSDYLYRAQDLICLEGRRYNAQRNQINHFTRDYSNCVFKRLEANDVASLINYLETEFAINDFDSAFKREEKEMTLDVLTHLEEYSDLQGAVLRIDNNIAGFSFGEKKGDTLYVHIEKATRKYHGIYQFLSNCFVKLFATPEIIYVNREEDMGDLGLRKAKLSYHPIDLQKKFTVEVDLS